MASHGELQVQDGSASFFSSSSCSFFQDARAFLLGSGERGPQMKVIPPGTYRINPLLFTVELANALDIPQGKVGVVEAHDGKALPSGRVVAKGIECDSYQDAKNFFAAGGERGPQVKLIHQDMAKRQSANGEKPKRGD